MSRGIGTRFKAKIGRFNYNFPVLIYTVSMVMQLSQKSQQYISRKLKEIRTKRNLLQEEVAKMSGISTTYYAGIERGEENPTIAVMENICKSLKVKSSEVLPF